MHPRLHSGLSARPLNFTVRCPHFMSKHAFTLLLLLIGLAAIATPRDTLAQGATPKVEEGPGPYSIDLDVAAGRAEERFLKVPGSAFTVKGLIQFVTVRPDPKWESVAGIEVTGPTTSFYAGLIAFVSPKAADKIEFAVRDERLNGLPDASFGRIHLTNQAILSSSPGQVGTVTSIRHGHVGQTCSGSLIRNIARRLLGSTAHVRFLNMKLPLQTVNRASNNRWRVP